MVAFVSTAGEVTGAVTTACSSGAVDAGFGSVECSFVVVSGSLAETLGWGRPKSQSKSPR